MREIVARAFSESNTMSVNELQKVLDEYDKIAPHDRTFEEKMGQNLAEEKLRSIERVATEVAQEDKVAELTRRIEELEQKSKE